MIPYYEINKILKYKNRNLFDETSLSSFQNDRDTDYFNFFKKKISKKIIILKIINLLFKIIFLIIKIFIQELLFNPLRNQITLNGNIFLCYNRKNLKNNWYKKIKIKKKVINFTSPYPTISERKILGNISLKNYFKAIKVFILTSFFLFKEEKKIINFLYCLFEIMKIEKFFTYLLCFQVSSNLSSKKLKIFIQYENLARDKIVIKYLSDYKVYACVCTPIMRFDRPNINFFYKSFIYPKNYIFFYEEKFFAFKKYLKKDQKCKILFKSINKNKNKNKNYFITKSFLEKNKISKILLILSDKKDEEKYFLKFKNINNFFIKFHPSSVFYKNDKINIDNKTLILCSEFTNDGYFYHLKNKKVAILQLYKKKNFSYKYINLPILNKLQLVQTIKYINYLNEKKNSNNN